MFVKTYGRSIVAVVTALVAWLMAARTDGHISPLEWQVLIIAATNAVLVYAVPHYPTARWIKPAIAVILAVTAYLVAHTGGIHGSAWWDLIVVGLGALGVVVSPSRSKTEG